MKHVFISYKHDDKAFVRQIEQKIKEADINTWTDAQIKAGEKWRQVIDDAIHDAFALVVIMNKQARKSEFVTYEWAYAMGRGIPVIALKTDDCDLHTKLEPLQFVDFSVRGDEDWDELISTLKAFDESSKKTTNIPKTVENTSNQLDNLNRGIRTQAINALEQMLPHPAAINAVENALKENLLLDIREEALSILKSLDSYSARQAILYALQHDNTPVIKFRSALHLFITEKFDNEIEQFIAEMNADDLEHIIKRIGSHYSEHPPKAKKFREWSYRNSYDFLLFVLDRVDKNLLRTVFENRFMTPTGDIAIKMENIAADILTHIDD